MTAYDRLSRISDSEVDLPMNLISKSCAQWFRSLMKKHVEVPISDLSGEGKTRA